MRLVLRLEQACWWAGPGPRGSGAVACLLVCGAGSWCLWLQGPGVPCLVPVHWCVGLGPGPSDGQGHVQGWLLSQGILRQPVCWWVVTLPSWLLDLRFPSTGVYRLVGRGMAGSSG